MSEITDWLKEYDRYLDGEIEYRDLPPRPAPPPPCKEMTEQEVKAMVSGAFRSADREARKFTAIIMVPMLAITTAMYLAGANIWAVIAAPYIVGAGGVYAFDAYLGRRDKRSPEKRDPTLDETSRD